MTTRTIVFDLETVLDPAVPDAPRASDGDTFPPAPGARRGSTRGRSSSASRGRATCRAPTSPASTRPGSSLDRAVGALGNAVVPDVAEVIGRAIMRGLARAEFAGSAIGDVTK